MSEGHRPFRRRFLINVAATGLGSGWAMVIAFVSLPLLLRGLGPDAYGLWVLLQTFSSTSGWFSIADAGLGTATTAHVAHLYSLDDREQAADVISSSIAGFLALGVVLAGGLATIGTLVLPIVFQTPPDLEHDFRVAIALFAASVLFDQVTNAAEASLEGLQRVDLSRSIDTARRTLVAIGTVSFALAGGGLSGAAVGTLAGCVVTTVIAVVVLRRSLDAGLPRPSWDHIRDLLRRGRVIAVLRPLGVLHRQLDRLVVGIILGPEAVVLVEIAVQLQNGAEAVLSAVTYPVIPAASWVRARRDDERLRELLVFGTKYTLLATLPVAVGLAALSRPIVEVWAGPSYAEAAPMAVVALAYTVVTASSQVASNLLVGVGSAGTILRAATIAIVLNLIGSVILVHRIGAIGTFIATLLGAAVIVPILTRGAVQLADTTVRTLITKAVLPCIPPIVTMLIGVVAVDLAGLGPWANIIVGVSTGFVLYLSIAFLTSISRAELGELRSIVRRSEGAPADQQGADRPGGASQPPTR